MLHHDSVLAAIRKFCQQVNSNSKQRGGSSSSAGHDDADDEDSGDESVADSSPLSSHGETESMEEPKKPKRTRTAFSNLQLDQLELAFSRSHYPDVFTREDLSTKLNIKEDRIQVRPCICLQLRNRVSGWVIVLGIEAGLQGG